MLRQEILDNHKLSQAKKKGFSLQCAVCHSTISIGENIVENTKASILRFRHEQCFRRM